jgi:phosphohistidine swiveling domain-containing protein
VSWEIFARRSHAPLSARLLQEAQRPPFLEEETGIPAGLHNHVWLRDSIYIPTSETRALREAVESVLPAADWAFLGGFIRRCGAALERLASTAAAVAVDPPAAAAELGAKLDRWLRAYRGAMAFVPIFRTIDQVLSSYVPEDEVATLLGASSRHLTEEVEERIALAKIVSRLAEIGDNAAEGDEAAALIASHIERFGWLGMRWHLGSPFNEEDIRRRVSALLSTGGGQRVGGRLAPALESDDSRQVLVSELAYLRSHRAEAVSHAIWVASPLFASIARFLRLPAADIPYLLPEELVAALAGGRLDLEVPAARRQAFATVLLEDTFADAAGVEAVEELSQRIGVEGTLGSYRPASVAPGSVLLRGVVASPGRARGPVRLVHTEADDSKVEQGDILVTTMTFPSLVGSMQRSAAIVTDDGGLLSHAAVTARELGKPCLIDTDTATEVLADGELVEVDCEVGVVNYVSTGADEKQEERSRP